MNEELAKLVDRARKGEPDGFDCLVQALRDQCQGNISLLLECLHSSDPFLRLAAIWVAAGRTEPEILQAVALLSQDSEVRVRFYLAKVLADFPAWPLDQAGVELLNDPDCNVRQSANWLVRARRGLLPKLLERFHVEGVNWLRRDIAEVLVDFPPHSVLFDVLRRLAEDYDYDVQCACAFTAERLLNNLGHFPEDLPTPPRDKLNKIRRRLQEWTGGQPGGSYAQLFSWIKGHLSDYVDVEELANFGTVLTVEADKGELPRAYGVDQALEAIKAVLTGPGPKAVVLLGESGTGKTAVVHELVHRLRQEPAPWYVLRLLPTDFMTGTRYLGDWETRVHNIVTAVCQPRRVLLYVPNIEELAWMGMSNKSDANVASALAPYLQRGDIAILGESTLEGFRKGLGANRSLRSLFHAIQLTPKSPKETRDILQAVAAEVDAEVPDQVLDRIGELADFYGSSMAPPGRSVGLLRRVLAMTAGRKGPISERDVLQTISTSTGIPVGFLDDAEALDRSAVRAFFETRVMGQPEAVDAVVDLVTLIKAGLTDPHKPFGVLLFVGPTGVGKTELARALAEHLFGDAGRMIRLDMSEFATCEAFERLIGHGYRASEPGILTAAVRERPFAVLLFDEIEKAHPNIYNLCLQIFDAGRLTDAQGRTADFRRTIIILTSNVGSHSATEGMVGFGQRQASTPDREVIMRELGRWFRPEFLNRLDRIVVFRSLAMETAEKIARREVANVLERGGITRRRLAVDVEPAVLPLLLKEGYSASFGARPLKRTVERLVLLPVAQAIAEGKVPAGSVLRLVARKGRVDIAVEAPEPVEETPPPPPPPPPVAEHAQALLDRVQALFTQAAPLNERKSTLLAQAAEPTFWNDQAASRRILDEVYRLDGLLAGLDNLAKKVGQEVENTQSRDLTDRDLERIARQLEIFEGEANHLAFLVNCKEPQALGDALVVLRLVIAQGKGLNGVATLAKMYVKLVKRRGLEVEVVDDRQGGDPPEDTITLLVNGVGAYALLADEGGIHQLGRGHKEGGERRRQAEREVVRVEVLPAPVDEGKLQPDQVQVEVRPLGNRPGRLVQRLKFDIRLFHAPTMTAVRAWSDGPKNEVVERLQSVLRARLEAGQNKTAEPSPPMVRRYRLGPTTLVRDVCSGRSTARLDQVLDGHLEMFWRDRK